jgi:GINS complex subunit 2
MDPAEVEFLAEKELISVVPNFTQDKIYLIGVSFYFSMPFCF